MENLEAKPLDGEEDDYWNESSNKAYSFDDVDINPQSSGSIFNRKHKLLDDNVSELSYELPQSEVAINLIISDHDLQMILDEQARKEFTFPKNIPLDEEVRLLRRQIRDYHHAPSPETTISKILFGIPVQLNAHKSLKEKEILLDLAIDSGDGNAILQVVLFLEKTLNRKIFYQLLQIRPIGVNHYVNFLTKTGKIGQCSDFLTMLGHHNEVSMLQFSTIIKQNCGMELKRQKIKSIYNDFFAQPGSCPFFSQMMANYLNLLDWQIAEKSKGTPNSLSLLGKSVLESLYYCSQTNNWSETQSTTINNPYVFCKQYQITQSQFEWVILTERGNSQAWCDLDGLFEKKQFLKKSFHMNIPLDKAILRLHHLKAPQPILNQILSRIEDNSKKLALARKVDCTKSIIDALVGMKAKLELGALREKLPKGTPDRFYADNAFDNMK